MKRLCVLLGVLLGTLALGPGCADADRAQWNEALRDANGDNMKLHYNTGSSLDQGSLSAH